MTDFSTINSIAPDPIRIHDSMEGRRHDTGEKHQDSDQFRERLQKTLSDAEETDDRVEIAADRPNDTVPGSDDIDADPGKTTPDKIASPAGLGGKTDLSA